MQFIQRHEIRIKRPSFCKAHFYTLKQFSLCGGVVTMKPCISWSAFHNIGNNFLTIRCNVEHFLSLFLEFFAGTFAEIWYRHFLFMSYMSILCSIILSILKVLPSHQIILYVLKLHVTIKHIFLYFNKTLVFCFWSSFRICRWGNW